MAPRKTVSQRIDALYALDTNGGAEFACGIAKALKDRSSNIRTNAVHLVKEHRIVDLLNEIEVCFTDPQWMVRTEAAVCFGDLAEQNGKPRPALRKLLKDPHWVVRIDAMESLAALQDHRALRLIANLLNDENGKVRSYCAGILVEMGGQTYKRKLLERLNRETEPSAMVGLLSALFATGEKRLLTQLLTLLGSDVYQIRCAVVHSLENVQMTASERATVITTFRRVRRNEPTRAVRSTITTVLKKLANRRK
jgi:HEAT repeat protein